MIFYGVLFVTLMAPFIVGYFLIYGPLTGAANPFLCEWPYPDCVDAPDILLGVPVATG